MMARWGICACLALLLALSAGCRTPQPVLKPAPEQEVLNSPPNQVKYATPQYPEQAFEKPVDPVRAAFDSKLPGNLGGGGRGGGAGGMGGGPSTMNGNR
jgi:hypothetical protein